MHVRALLVAVLTLLVVGGTTVASTAFPGGSEPSDTRVRVGSPPDPVTASDPEPSPTPSAGEAPGEEEVPPMLDRSADVSVEVDGWLAWAALDRASGERVSSANASETSSMESMIKIWLVADLLRRLEARGEQPTDQDLRDASLAIRDSHNGAAQRLYEAGGQDAVVQRMIEICGLTDTYIPEQGSGWWSRTEMSPRDAIRLGECVAEGTAAGSTWTEWVLDEMQRVRGTTADEDQQPEHDFEGGNWGIVDGLPEQLVEAGVSIKNGWTRIGRDDSWHLNCLAITGEWVMAVMMRYPAGYSLDYGAKRCASVARQLIDTSGATRVE